MSPSLTLSLGFRDEFSTGWNEAYGRASNYTYREWSDCRHAHHRERVFHHQPREIPAAAAHRPGVESLGSQDRDSRGIRHVQRFAGCARLPRRSECAVQSDVYDCLWQYRRIFIFRSIPSSATANALLVPGGVQPDMYTPTVLTYSLRVERELSPNTSLSVGYVGSHGYHELIGVDANAPAAGRLPGSRPVRLLFPICDSSVHLIGRWLCPPGTFYVAPGTKKPNPSTRQHLDLVFRRRPAPTTPCRWT